MGVQEEISIVSPTSQRRARAGVKLVAVIGYKKIKVKVAQSALSKSRGQHRGSYTSTFL